MVTPDIILEFKYTQLLVRKLHNSSKRHPLLGVCNITWPWNRYRSFSPAYWIRLWYKCSNQESSCIKVQTINCWTIHWAAALHFRANNCKLEVQVLVQKRYRQFTAWLFQMRVRKYIANSSIRVCVTSNPHLLSGCMMCKPVSNCLLCCFRPHTLIINLQLQITDVC